VKLTKKYYRLAIVDCFGDTWQTGMTWETFPEAVAAAQRVMLDEAEKAFVQGLAGVSPHDAKSLAIEEVSLG